MTVESDMAPEPAVAAPAAPSAMPRTRPFYWSVRRELWENRSLVIAPLAAAGVILFGFSLGAMGVSHSTHALARIGQAKDAAALAIPFDIAAVVVMITGFIVAVFYCLGALHNERRDRSILFWKSLPVSDLITVASKAAMPMAVLPAILFAIIFATQLVMLLLGSVVMALHGLNVGALWAQVASPMSWLVLVYGLVVVSLWNAPIYGWLLLVSAWSRRAAFLWAVLPPLALCLVEKIAFDTGYIFSMIGYRLTGGFSEAFAPQGEDPIGHTPVPDPIHFLGTPAVWIGLAVGAGFLGGAVWLRRRREPI